MRRMSVARKVDGEDRVVDREGHGVPRVGVLRSAVQEHELGRFPTPRQGADRPGARFGLDAPHSRRTTPWNSEFLRVFVEERELVVRRGSGHER